MKYLEEDLEAIRRKEKTVKEVADKYGVSQNALIRCLNRRKYYIRKMRIKIKTPYKTTVVDSLQECADTLHLSKETIRQAIKGKRIKTLEDLNIKLEVVNNDYRFY